MIELNKVNILEKIIKLLNGVFHIKVDPHRLNILQNIENNFPYRFSLTKFSYNNKYFLVLISEFTNCIV